MPQDTNSTEAKSNVGKRVILRTLLLIPLGLLTVLTWIGAVSSDAHEKLRAYRDRLAN